MKMRLFYRSPSLDDYLEEEDYLVCTLCGEPWTLYHVCWLVEWRWALTLAYTFVKKKK